MKGDNKLMFKIKFEDVKIAEQMFEHESYLFIFNLNVKIAEQMFEHGSNLFTFDLKSS